MSLGGKNTNLWDDNADFGEMFYIFARKNQIK